MTENETTLAALETLWRSAADAEDAASRALDAAEERQRESGHPDPYFPDILAEFQASRDANAALRRRIARTPARSIHDALIKARVAIWCYGGDEEDIEAQLTSLMSASERHEPCAATMALVLALDLVRLSTAVVDEGSSADKAGRLRVRRVREAQALAQVEKDLADKVNGPSRGVLTPR